MGDEPLDASSRSAADRTVRSRLALASGVMGLVSLPLVCFGAGLSGALAAVLGMMALERIRASGGMLRGKAWAWTGIATGLLTIVLSMAWFSFANATQRDWNIQLDDGIRRTFSASDDPAARVAITSWSGKASHGVSVASLQEFAVGVRERLGALDSISLVSQDASAGNLSALLVVHVVNLGFEKGTRSAVVSTELRTPVDSWTPTLKLLKIHLNDAGAPGGEIVFPPGITPAKVGEDEARHEAQGVGPGREEVAK